MKKKIVAMLSLVLCLVLCISLAACSGDKHEAKSEWKSDNTQHWHECATDGHTDKLDVADHTWNDGEVTADPTEAEEGVKTFTCTVCKATKTVPIDKLEHKHTYATEWSKDATNHWHASACGHDIKSNEAAHTFGNWTVKVAANIHIDRVEERKCSVCEYTEERTIPDTATHDFDFENIKSDENNHWFECSCDEKTDIEAHTYGDWSEKTAAGVDQNKQYSRKCTECQHEDVLTFDNTQTNGTYCVAVTEVFVINGEKIISVKVVRGTITTGDNLVFDGVDGEFSVDKIVVNKKVLDSASCGDSVELYISADSGDISQINNSTVGCRLAYGPGTVSVHTTFTAQITIDKSNFSGHLIAGKSVYLDLYGTDAKMISCNLVLPEDVTVAEDGESYIVTITLPADTSRALWAGMEFTYKVYDSASSTYIAVATGIILSVAD